MLVGKTYEQIIEDMKARLEATIPGASFSAGSIVRALLSSIGEEISDAYRTIDFALEMVSLSTSSGIFLDMLGRMFGCERLEGEDDENYRARIQNSEYARAGANESAIRMACLAAPYVRDVVIKKYAYGPGSFVIYVIPEDRELYSEAVSAVESILQDQAASGIQAFVMRPIEIPIDMHIVLALKEGLAQYERDQIAGKVKEALAQYIENIEPDGEFIDTEAIRIIKNQSSAIVDFEVVYFGLGGLSSFFSDHRLEWNERFVPGNIVVQ